MVAPPPTFRIPINLHKSLWVWGPWMKTSWWGRFCGKPRWKRRKIWQVGFPGHGRPEEWEYMETVEIILGKSKAKVKVMK